MVRCEDRHVKRCPNYRQHSRYDTSHSRVALRVDYYYSVLLILPKDSTAMVEICMNSHIHSCTLLSLDPILWNLKRQEITMEYFTPISGKHNDHSSIASNYFRITRTRTPGNKKIGGN